MLKHHIEHALREALADTPVVLLNGVRQAGKSTLVEHIAETVHLHGATPNRSFSIFARNQARKWT